MAKVTRLDPVATVNKDQGHLFFEPSPQANSFPKREELSKKMELLPYFAKTILKKLKPTIVYSNNSLDRETTDFAERVKGDMKKHNKTRVGDFERQEPRGINLLTGFKQSNSTFFHELGHALFEHFLDKFENSPTHKKMQELWFDDKLPVQKYLDKSQYYTPDIFVTLHEQMANAFSGLMHYRTVNPNKSFNQNLEEYVNNYRKNGYEEFGNIFKNYLETVADSLGDTKRLSLKVQKEYNKSVNKYDKKERILTINKIIDNL